MRRTTEEEGKSAILERAYAQRDGGLSAMKAEPLFRTLHADPRWTTFLRKMGLAD